MPPEMRICAVIPAFNEAGLIADVIRGTMPHVAGIVVVDDGSTDETQKIAEKEGAACLRHTPNQGKGVALREGISYACSHDYTHVLFMDGDQQHLPQEIPNLVQAARETGADLVVGARDFDRARMPRSRHFSNSVGSRIASWLAGREIKDSQSGFRLARLDKLRLLKLRARKYEIEMEILLKMCMAGCTVAHAPVTLVYKGGRASSKMNPIRDTTRICFWSLFFRFLKM